MSTTLHGEDLGSDIPHFTDELLRGADPEELQELGYPIDPNAEPMQPQNEIRSPVWDMDDPIMLPKAAGKLGLTGALVNAEEEGAKSDNVYPEEAGEVKESLLPEDDPSIDAQEKLNRLKGHLEFIKLYFRDVELAKNIKDNRSKIDDITSKRVKAWRDERITSRRDQMMAFAGWMGESVSLNEDYDHRYEDPVSASDEDRESDFKAAFISARIYMRKNLTGNMNSKAKAARIARLEQDILSLETDLGVGVRQQEDSGVIKLAI